MRMRAKKNQIDIDLVREFVDVGELAKLGAKCGFTVVIDRGNSADGEDPDAMFVRLIRMGQVWGDKELLDLAVIYGVVYGRSGQQIVDHIEQQLRGLHFPMDKPISDVMAIGEAGDGHGGHED